MRHDHQAEPETDAEGFAVFPYEGCDCPGCMTMRAQHDSHTVEMIARVVRRMHKAAAKMHAHEPTELEYAEATSRFDVLYEGMTEALQKWEPAMPVQVN